MGNCGQDKRKFHCGQRLNSVCVFYDGYIPEDSDLSGEECITVEETIDDLYHMIDDIKENIDLSDLGDKCIDYDEEEPGKIKVKEALIKFEELICELKENSSTTTVNGIDLSKIDPKCLINECQANFTSVEQLLQAIIDKLCICCANEEPVNLNLKGIL